MDWTKNSPFLLPPPLKRKHREGRLTIQMLSAPSYEDRKWFVSLYNIVCSHHCGGRIQTAEALLAHVVDDCDVCESRAARVCEICFSSDLVFTFKVCFYVLLIYRSDAFTPLFAALFIGTLWLSTTTITSPHTESRFLTSPYGVPQVLSAVDDILGLYSLCAQGISHPPTFTTCTRLQLGTTARCPGCGSYFHAKCAEAKGAGKAGASGLKWWLDPTGVDVDFDCPVVGY